MNNQKQTRSGSRGQTKAETAVLMNVIPIAILAITSKGGIVDGVGPLQRRNGATLTIRSSRVTASPEASHARNHPTLRIDEKIIRTKSPGGSPVTRSDFRDDKISSRPP